MQQLKPVEKINAHTYWENIKVDPILSSMRGHVHCTYYSELDKKWCREQINDPYCRLYLVSKGRGHLLIQDKEITLEPGYLYLIPSNTQHSHSCDSEIHFYWCHFQVESGYGLDLFDILELPIRCKTQEPNTDEQLMQRLVELNSDSATWRILQRSACLLNLLAPFFKTAVETDMLDSKVDYFLVIRFINEHLDQAITLEQLAAINKASPEHFNRKFKQVFGIPPIAYVTKKRIQKSQALLQDTQFPVKKVGALCGFTDPYHFSKMFKKYVGVSPNHYRKKK
ncbi:hypothetical protein C2869_04035 [Saccharobesus litoralis]|uniref:HTH araC/xylS-type domain-containing protein n=1 Tax=Saccharobesus litoralis TaxID=2172099 RepID=A0A2S0VN80_9ALTE|nr:AraC family transcriptional regulator [Saccharobesus litoralis]AWB65656.1 hypothetical protein C2869_04035 [Saccharobesus litoralis]